MSRSHDVQGDKIMLIQSPTIQGLETFTKDVTAYRKSGVGTYEGSSTLTTGDLATYLNSKACEYYMAFNFKIDASGNFLGRDADGVCVLHAIASDGVEYYYFSAFDVLGVVPVLNAIYFTDGSGINANIGFDTPNVGKFSLIQNSRIEYRVSTTATGGATPTINTDLVDEVHYTAQDANITSFTTNLSGTPKDGDTLFIEITADGTPRAVTWGASFESSSLVTLPTTIPASTLITTTLKWNVATTKWRCIGVS